MRSGSLSQMNRLSFKNKRVDPEDCTQLGDQYRGIYEVYPQNTIQNRTVSTCNRSDFPTLGSNSYFAH